MSSTGSAQTTAPTSTRQAVLNTIKGSLGNLVEWYDVYTYTVFVTYFEAQFFDQKDENSTVYAYAVFAVTFIMRPLGSWYFGRFADRRGRRAALTASVAMMATASFVIALMPTRATIGGFAAVGLIICRLIQGFATGGEYGTSSTYMSEAATRDRRGFFSSFQYVTLVGGHVLAQLTLLLLVAVLSEDALKDWGWRIPFAIGGLSAVVVFWMRRTMDESLSKEHLEEVASGDDSSSGTIRELVTHHKRAAALCFLFTAGGTLAFYVYSVTGPAIVKDTYEDSPTTATLLNLFGLAFLMLMPIAGGLLSDKIGRKPLLVGFAVGALLWTYVFVTYLPKTTAPLMTFLMLIVSYTILTGYTSVNAIVKAELFPARIRALGLGLSYGLANSAFGGTAPLIYEALKKNHIGLFVLYVMVVVTVSLITYILFLRNKAETHIDREQGYAYETAPAR